MPLSKNSYVRHAPWNLVKPHQQNEKPRNFRNNEVEQPPRSDVAISIKEMLQKLPPIAKKCSIYRVPRRLLNIHPTAYTPQVISIGPFHHCRHDLMPMEQLKLRFLNSYLCRIKSEVEAVLTKAQNLENEARNCYAEPINMKKDEFVKMMLVDGCFIVELMMTVDDPQNGLDPLLYEPLSIDLYRDLTMLENQLPFFVLETLFDLYPPDAKKYVSFKELACNFFVKGSIDPCKCQNSVPTQTVNHLVDFLSFCYAPLTVLTTCGINTESENQPNLSPTSASGNGSGSENRLNLPPTATELLEAGVVFKRATEDKHIMDISFKNGVIEIPPFEIHDVFETYLRNLIAFEQFSIGHGRRYVIHYVSFLDGLISTGKDVSLLVKAKIITNNIGGNGEEIAKLFNDLCKDVTIASDHYYFDGISKDLHKYCRRRRNQWMASLRRDYFNTPWASISFFAATLLILLTLIQTISSVLSLL